MRSVVLKAGGQKSYNNVWFWQLKKYGSPKNENTVINYSPSCRSKPARPSFMFITQIVAQKCSKDIVKMVHVTSGVQLSFYKAPKLLFVHKENKNSCCGDKLFKSFFFFGAQKVFS